MMPVKILKDDDARRTAISRHDRSILVEAGAGSGKTAVMAGRIALMLAEGVAPRTIAAVTFTELAASELLSRVREFVEELASGHVAPELRAVLPNGITPQQLDNLTYAREVLEEITCSTIHGFCQRLIKPSPVEADIDPGAFVMDRSQADLIFLEIVDAWLRERLSGGQGGVLAEMVLRADVETVALMHRIAESLRRRRTLRAPSAGPLGLHVQAFRHASAALSTFLTNAPALESETIAIAERLSVMAAALPAEADVATPAELVALLVTSPDRELCTDKGAFRSYSRKGKWEASAKAAGLSKVEGARLSEAAKGHYTTACEAWTAMIQTAASSVLAALIDDAEAILGRYAEHKRSAAVLDFDDLIHAARDMLRDHEAVRRALGARYARVLVDEFQDTDPLQSEIFWRLCGDPCDEADDWTTFRIRPGALFLVGDPKQAIYRFRGADVGAYVQARSAFSAQDGDNLIAISTNFRSSSSILTFVNERFEAVLSADGQPGFVALDAFHDDPAIGIRVAALDVQAAGEDGTAKAERQRDAEAEAIAEFCSRLIGSFQVKDRRSATMRACQPGDIALLAPTGTDLWRYEEALERRGVPVATQAGKGLYRRQEVQDLIALTRVLADGRDTLALGALLRGPLVGLTEEQLLDVVSALPRPEGEQDRIPRLDLSVEAALITNPLARDVIARLQALRKAVNSTTPHDLLSRAVDLLRMRPILLDRHRGRAERALSNVDLYLSLSANYAVRGLRAFAEAMTSAWENEARAVEGRPDAQEEAVALFTMHAAKGLEWPIVIPINTMTIVNQGDAAIVDRATETFYGKVLGVAPSGYDAALKAEREELNRERIRLWYVAATRARELLVLPRLDVALGRSTWVRLVDLLLPDLPSLDVSQMPADPVVPPAGAVNGQTREIFAEQAAVIVERQTRLAWLAPSRDEQAEGAVVIDQQPELWAGSIDASPKVVDASPPVQGGRERGLVLHKLMEEVLTGEVSEGAVPLRARSSELIRALGRAPVDDAAIGLSPDELTTCVLRTLALPEVADLRARLVAEFPVYSLREAEEGMIATAGIADALTADADGRPEIVIDWKSDVAPDERTLQHYRAQVRAYLDMTGAAHGLIVLMTTGVVIPVEPSAQASAA